MYLDLKGEKKDGSFLPATPLPLLTDTLTAA